MAIADTITSMQTHTSNAYTMIGYGTDLTGINKNLENLSPSIFNAFLEALRTPDTLFTNLPKKSGSGSVISLNDTANAPMRIELGSRELEQATTTGKNLLDTLATSPKSDGATYSQDLKSVVVDFSNSQDEYFGIITGMESPTTKAYTLSFIVSGVKSNETIKYRVYGGATAKTLKNGLNIFNIPLGASLSNNRLLFDDADRGGALTSVVSFTDFMYVEGTYTEETMPTYEPYTGGIASPNPSYPQDIHTISGSNTIRVKNANVLDPNTFVSSTYITGIDNNTSVITFTPNTTFITPTIFDNMNLEAGEYTVYCEVLTGAYTGGNMLLYDENNAKYTEWAFKNSDTHIFNLNATNGIKTIKLWNPINEVITTIKLWIAKGTYTSTTMPTFEPYTSQETNIDLGYENLFDFNTTTPSDTVGNNNGVYARLTHTSSSITIKGKPGATYTIYALRYVPNVKNGVSYTFSANVKGTNPQMQLSLKLRNSSNQDVTSFIINKVNNYVQTKTVDLTGVTNATFVIEGLSTSAEYDLEADIMLNEGSTALTYTPTGKAIEYSKIGNYEDKFIRTSGKNLYDGTTSATDKRISTSGTGTYTQAGYSVSNFVEIKPSTNYTLTSGIISYFCYYDSSKTYISGTTWTSGTSKTTPNNAYYIKFDFETNAKVMFNEGTTALDYEPYGSKDEWYIKKNIGKVVLNGSETWNTSGNCYYTEIPLKRSIHTAQAGNLISNYFVSSNASSSSGVAIGGMFEFYHATINNKNVGFNYDNASDLAGFKTWLGTHNVIVDYILDTPTYTQITGTLAEQLENVYKNMLSQKGQTNISQINNDLPFVINASAIEEV